MRYATTEKVGEGAVMRNATHSPDTASSVLAKPAIVPGGVLFGICHPLVPRFMFSAITQRACAPADPWSVEWVCP
jgi:hypothetical protein